MVPEEDSVERTLLSPRLTMEYLKSRIASEHYHHFPVTRTTVCSVLLVNGFSITASVVCKNTDLYDEAIGQKHAMTKVLDKLRKREYYLLRQRLHEDEIAQKGESDGR